MDHGHVSPFVIIVIVLSVLCFIAGLTYVTRDHLSMRRYAQNHPVADENTEVLMPEIVV